jgi:hypothetical protein
METRASGKAAPPGAMSLPLRPTYAPSEEEYPFAPSDGEQETDGATAGETESADFRENPGKQLCEHVILSGEENSGGETSADKCIEIMEQDGGDNAVMQGCEPDSGGKAHRSSHEMTVDDEDGPPAEASTPQRSWAVQFRIVDIERKTVPRDIGDVNSAKSPAYPQARTGDENSAEIRNSGIAPIPPRSDEHRASGDVGRTGAGPGPGPTMNPVIKDVSKARGSRDKKKR